MFSELIKLRELGRLLRRQRYLEVLKLARDPAIRDHRKAVEAAEKARVALKERAARYRDRGEITQALRDVKVVLRDGDDAELAKLEHSVREAMVDRERRARSLGEEVDRARALVSEGRVAEALARLEPLAEEDLGAASFVEALKAHQADAIATAEHARHELARGRLREARQVLADLRSLEVFVMGIEELHADLLNLALRRGDDGFLAMVLADTAGVAESGDGPLKERQEHAAARLLDAVDRELEAGHGEEAQAWLAVFPLGVKSDAQAEHRAQGLRKLDRARRIFREGDRELAEQLAREALAALPASPHLDAWLAGARRRDEGARSQLEVARGHLAGGRLQAAEEAVGRVLDGHGDHREARELLEVIARQEADDIAALQQARDLLDGGNLQEARAILVALELRRPDLESVPALLRDAERRSRETRLKVLEAESRILAPGIEGANIALASRGLREAERLGPGSNRLREAAEKLAQLGSSRLDPGRPFVMRIEEQGDWFVHPGDQVVIGNSMRGRADLPVLAAIASRHAIIRRERDEAAEDAVYYIEAGRDRHGERKELQRNRRVLHEDVAILEHGDVISLGGVLNFTFLKPVPGNATAVLRIAGDFTVHGCSRVILSAETGRAGSIIIGPGPMAHVPLAQERDQVEILRPDQGELQGTLLARCRRGIAIEDGPERPQVKPQAARCLRAGNVRIFLDPLG